MTSVRGPRVGEFMSSPVLTTPPGGLLEEAVSRMAEENVGSLVISLDGRPTGVITERDVMAFALASGWPPGRVKVREAARGCYGVIGPDGDLAEVARLLIASRGRVVVFDSGELLGIVSVSDAVRAFSTLGVEGPPVSSFMTRRVRTLESTRLAVEAMRVLRDERIGSVLVVEGREPVGVFSERDVLTRVLHPTPRMGAPLSEVSSGPVITIHPDASARDASGEMARLGIKRLFVEEGGDVVGVVTARDLVEIMARA